MKSLPSSPKLFLLFLDEIKNSRVIPFSKNPIIRPQEPLKARKCLRQHGFRKHRSCLTQLLQYYDTVLTEVTSGRNVDVIYADFAKCFDKIDIGILLHKIKGMGISGEIGTWLSSFLTNRKNRVKVGQTLSEESLVTSGLPQGTCLGPVLLLIMNNDIGSDFTKSQAFCFADDTKVMKSVQNSQDIEDLQLDLNRLYNWAESNNMKFNEGKFALLRFGHTTEWKSPIYGPQNTQIQETQDTKDLGIIISSSTSFNTHINQTVASCQKISGMILRSFKTREPRPLLLLFKTLVLSKLDYGSVLWTPQDLQNRRKLEKVQANYTRHLNGMALGSHDRLDYWQRLSELKMYSIERRHERYIAFYMWKILNELVENPGIIFHQTGRRGILAKIPEIRHCNRARENSFLVRGPRVFNALPGSIRNRTITDRSRTGTKSASDKFKTCLDSFLVQIPDTPNVSSAYSSRMLATDATGRKSNSIVDLTNF